MKVKTIFLSREEIKNRYYIKVIIFLQQHMPVKKETETTAAKRTPAAKTTTRKTTTRKATPTSVVKKTQASNLAKENARHIEENAQEIKNNSSMIHLLYGFIIFLLLIIAGLAFYVGQMVSKNNIPGWVVTTTTAEEVTITVIDDSRCSDCQTDAVSAQIQALPYLSSATFINQDFSDSWVADYMIENDITALPAIIFSSNNLNDGGQISSYLTVLPDGQYSLALGAKFDPFAQRSDAWFLILEQDVLTRVQEWLFINGNIDAPLTWFEYSDVNCFYCKKMAKDGTVEAVLESSWDSLNHTYVNYIGVGGEATQTAAEVLECIGDVAWASVYDSVFNKSLISEENTPEALISFAAENWADVTQIQTCIDEDRVSSIVASKFNTWREVFGITWTPGNVILNTSTGEYEVISGAYPANSFEAIVARMIGE